MAVVVIRVRSSCSGRSRIDTVADDGRTFASCCSINAGSAATARYYRTVMVYVTDHRLLCRSVSRTSCHVASGRLLVVVLKR